MHVCMHVCMHDCALRLLHAADYPNYLLYHLLTLHAGRGGRKLAQLGELLIGICMCKRVRTSGDRGVRRASLRPALVERGHARQECSSAA